MRRTTTPRRAAHGAHGRRGFSLVEVIIAIGFLATVALGFATFSQRMARASSVATQRSTASDLAVERLETVRGATTYASVDGYASTEATVSGYTAYKRRTYVQSTATATANHKTVTVVVTHIALQDSVVKTTVIAAF